VEMGRRLNLLEAYVAVLEERLDQYERGEDLRPHLHLVP